MRNIYQFTKSDKEWIRENYKCLPMQMADYLLDAIEGHSTTEPEVFEKTMWEAYAVAYNYYSALYMKYCDTERGVSFSEVPEVKFYSVSDPSNKLLDPSSVCEPKLELLHEENIMDIISDLDLDTEQCASAEAWEILPRKINIKYEMWHQLQSFDRESNSAASMVPLEILQEFDPILDSAEEAKPQPDPVSQILAEFDPLMIKQEPQQPVPVIEQEPQQPVPVIEQEPQTSPLMAEEPEQLSHQGEEVGLEGHVELDHIAQKHVCPVTQQVTLYAASLEPLVRSEGTQGVFIFDDGDNTDTICRILEVNDGDLQIYHNPEVSCHSPRRSIVQYLTSVGGSLIGTLEHSAYQRVWARAGANITVLFLGMWDILRNKLGTTDEEHFYIAFHAAIIKFVKEARESLTVAERRDFDKRMQLHVFVLVSPKKFPSDHNLMSFKAYDDFNFMITRSLRSHKKDLFQRYPRVMLCSPSYEYPRNLHQYISRLLCWKCSPRLAEWTLQAKNLHIGGCDNQYDEFWPDIQDINANVHPKFLRRIINEQRWLKSPKAKTQAKKPKKWYQKH